MRQRGMYTADFETNTHSYDVSVWAYAICDIKNVENVVYGNCIDNFMKWCEDNVKSTVFFHNLKFDGEFIISWLLTNGFKWEKKLKPTQCAFWNGKRWPIPPTSTPTRRGWRWTA